MTPNDQPIARKRSQQTRERRASFAHSVPKATKRVIGRSTTRETLLQIRTRRTTVDDTLRDYMRRRAGFKLGKFALRIVQLTVWVKGVAGPNGAPAYDCCFVVLLPGRREVVVAAADATVRAAFDSAVDATERAVRRRVQRGRAPSRRPRIAQ
jgi:ribosome-associated translation inhibitor RaiA